MFSSPDRSRLFGRGVRFLPVLLSVALASLVVTCTDAPSVPEGMGHGSLQIMPHFSFAGATTTETTSASRLDKHSHGEAARAASPVRFPPSRSKKTC